MRHGDFTPDNILVRPNGRAVLIDLGCARPFGQRSETLSGTPGFLAPELLRDGAGDARADLYALGATLGFCHQRIGLALTPALEQALEKGIPLYFVIEFELLRKRPLWFPEKVAQWSITYRVSYSSLTRQYRVSSGPLGQTFESLADVQRFLGHVSSRPVARVEELVKGARYEAAVRERLDVNQLPKPFQVNALASREWQLSSDWHRFDFTP